MSWLADAVRGAAQRFGDAAAFVEEDSGERLTFQDLDRRSDEVAAALAARGVGAGQRVVLQLPSGNDYVIAYAATAKVGAVAAGVNVALAPAEQERLVALADPAVRLRSFDDVRSLAQEGAGRAVRPGRSSGILVFTSGTTGLPKAAVFADEQLRAVTMADTGGEWAEAPGGAALGSTSFAHVGFMTKLPWYLQRGLRTHVLSRWRADDVLDVVEREAMAELGAVAPQVALLLRALGARRTPPPRLRRLVVGGAASSRQLVTEARQRLADAFLVRYSLTESGGCGLGTGADDSEAAALDGVGRPRGGVEAQVRDETGRLQPVDEPGELWLRSPTVMAGYFRDPQATAETLQAEWLRTGDRAVARVDGTYALVGRSKEMYVRGGYNVYPAEVETALCEHPAVADVAVVAREDPIMGEVGVAFAVARPTLPAPSLDELMGFLGPRLARWKHPVEVRWLPELPLTAMSKIDRQALRARL